jgi:anti-sigma factor RsiW
MSCRQVTTLLDTFRDGELPANQTLEVEGHLAGCDSCRERLRFGNAMRASLRRVVSVDGSMSPAFESRLSSAMRAERERILEASSPTPVMPSAARLRRNALLPAFLAAAATFAFVGWGNRHTMESSSPLPPDGERPIHTSASMVETPEQVLDELVDYHTAPPTPQITDSNLVPKLEPEVGVPVHLPALNLKQYGASWEGGSVVPMKNQRAAIFRYRLSNHPVTVYVYDARRVPLRGVLEPRVVHNQPVSVGERRGYSIAAREQRGVGYAVATDLNDDASAELVSTIY